MEDPRRDPPAPESVPDAGPGATLRPELGPDLAAEVHLFLASPSDWTSETGNPETLELLSPEERQRYRTMGHPLAQRLFLTGRALARSALSQYADVAPDRWVFEIGSHGRPRIGPGHRADSLDFNLAHTDRLVACLVTRNRTGGVDVEDTRRTLDPLRMAEHSFAPEEAADLKRLEGPARQERFLCYWTLKEAYLKARGSGFGLRLDAAAFRFSPRGALGVRFADAARDRPEDWRFELWRAPGKHLVAVALRHGGGSPVRVRTRWANPSPPPVFIDPRPLALDILASTGGRPRRDPSSPRRSQG